MVTKFEGYEPYPPDPEFEYLVHLSGALVPIAHIKIIGEVEYNVATMEDEEGNETPLCGFHVMLTDSNYEAPARENPQTLFESWETKEEAEEQRRNLAMQVDNYYKKLLGK